jgi:trigger factor
MDPPVFEFIIPLKASVELGDYHSIRLPYEQPEITDDRVEGVVSSLQDRQAIIEPVDRPAQEGDLVRLQLEGVRRSPAPDEDPALIRKRSHSVIIESPEPSTPSEWPFPGFAQQLIGRSAGEEFTLEHTFSEDAEYESLRGVDSEFHISIEQVNSRDLPALDDEFAKSAGEFETMDALRLAIRQDLETNETDEYNQTYDDKVLEEIVKISTIHYPPQMLDREIENVIERLESNLAQQKLDMELYLKARQMDIDGLKEEARPVAETRLKKTLALLEAADKEGIKIDPDELQSETTRTLNELSYVMEEKDFNKLIRTDANRTNIIGNVMMDLMMSRTHERLRQIARGIETASPPETAGSESDDIDRIDGASQVAAPVDEPLSSEAPASEIVEKIE